MRKKKKAMLRKVLFIHGEMKVEGMTSLAHFISRRLLRSSGKISICLLLVYGT